MRSRVIKQYHFVLGLIGLCCLYLGFEIWFNGYTALAVDEFWFAHLTYHYKDSLPYRDFSPYKTVLGYYFLLMPLLSEQGIMKTLIFTKNVMAVLNTLILFGSSWWLRRFFPARAVLAGLALLITTETVLTYSTNIRVDLLAYWFCFFSFLLLMEKRYLLAGILVGLGFAISQKAIWYIFASDCALAAYWLVVERDLKGVWNITRFNLTALLMMVAYIAFWSWIADLQTVLNSVFREAAILYQLDWYASARGNFWFLITLYNPLVVLLWPLIPVCVLVTYENDKSYYYRLLIVVYSLVILLNLVPYKMIFPYYMQVAIPVVFMFYTAFFTWLFAIFNPRQKIRIIVGTKGLCLFFICYFALIICVSTMLKLPEPYLVICLLPILLAAYLTNFADAQISLAALYFNLICVTFVFVGGIYPLVLFAQKTVRSNGDYQKAHVQAVLKLLQDGSDYVAGNDLIYNKTQPIAGMRLLVGPACQYLLHPVEKIRPFMLPSLYLDPNATVDSVILALKKSKVKFYVNNYRMEGLPQPIKSYLDFEYEHFWGSIYLYAPKIAAGKQELTIKFSGNYLIKNHNSNTYIHLEKGKYVTHAKIAYRLKLIPDQQGLILDKNFRWDEWNRIFS